MSLVFNMSSREIALAKAAAKVLIENYEDMVVAEKSAVHKMDLRNYVTAGHAFKYRLRHARAKGPFPLSHGELSVFERALRMLMQHHQVKIKKDMLDDEKAALRTKAQAAGNLLTRLRKARGLPW